MSSPFFFFVQYILQWHWKSWKCESGHAIYLPRRNSNDLDELEPLAQTIPTWTWCRSVLLLLLRDNLTAVVRSARTRLFEVHFHMTVSDYFVLHVPSICISTQPTHDTAYIWFTSSRNLIAWKGDLGLLRSENEIGVIIGGHCLRGRHEM